MNDERGQVTIMMQLAYRKPGVGNERTTWHKMVTVHTERNVTMAQAREIVEQWKNVNQEAIAEFRCAFVLI